MKKHSRMLTRIKNFFTFRKRNSYLDAHGFYESFKNRSEKRSPGYYFYMPYSLADILEVKKISGMNVFVASHVSTAALLMRRKNTVTLGRTSQYHWHGHVDMISSCREYRGDKLDIVIWDSHRMPDDWEGFIDAHLSPRGVVIIVYFDYFGAMEHGFGMLGDVLVKRGMKRLPFVNPGPHNDTMTAELFYPQDNVLDI